MVQAMGASTQEEAPALLSLIWPHDADLMVMMIDSAANVMKMVIDSAQVTAMAMMVVASSAHNVCKKRNTN